MKLKIQFMFQTTTFSDNAHARLEGAMHLSRCELPLQLQPRSTCMEGSFVAIGSEDKISAPRTQGPVS